MQPTWSNVIDGSLPWLHLQGHKFIRNFSDCPDEIYMCGKDIESANHFFFQCSLFLEERQVHINKIREIGSSLIGEIDSSYILTNMLTLSAIPFLLVKRTWMTIITPMFLTGSLTHICISKNIGVLEMIQSVIFKKVILINDNILLRLLEPKKM